MLVSPDLSILTSIVLLDAGSVIGELVEDWNSIVAGSDDTAIQTDHLKVYTVICKNSGLHGISIYQYINISGASLILLNEAKFTNNKRKTKINIYFVYFEFKRISLTSSTENHALWDLLKGFIGIEVLLKEPIKVQLENKINYIL